MPKQAQLDLPVIAVFPAARLEACPRIFQALSALYDVRFVPAAAIDLPSHRRVWWFGASRAEALHLAGLGIRVLAFAGGEAHPISDPRAKVRFSGSPALEGCFRGRSLDDPSLTQAPVLDQAAGDEILAEKGGHPLWIRPPARGVLDLVAVALPGLGEKEYLFEHFHWEKWAGLLPVLYFLKEVSPWQRPPLRACFMFDDPNLHWPTYGYADYAALAGDAAAHQYHAAFATVPADAWYTNRNTAAIFRQHPEYLSLVVHGNNHTVCELSSAGGEKNRRHLAAQAMQRMGRLEQKAGFAIPRVMVAPHEACDHAMAGALLQAGFEAACISMGSIMGQHPDFNWPVNFGLEVSEFLGGMLPVIPRFNIRLGRDAEVNALLAAFLGQPVIPVGHHDDLAQGPGLLRQLAGLINSVGAVAWQDMNRITESNFCTNRQGNSLGIRMYSRRIRLTVPEGVTRLWIDRPWLKQGAQETLVWQAAGPVQTVDPDLGGGIDVSPGAEIEISSVHPDKFDPWSVAVRGTPWWALLRRQLCELRDRLRPLTDRWFRAWILPRSGPAAGSSPAPEPPPDPAVGATAAFLTTAAPEHRESRLPSGLPRSFPNF